MHNQIKHPQGKLVHVRQVKVFDVAVDLCVGSDIFEQCVGEYLSENNKVMLWILLNFEDGFLVTNDTADFQYKCSGFFAPNYERLNYWADLSLIIIWSFVFRVKPQFYEKVNLAKPFSTAEDY